MGSDGGGGGGGGDVPGVVGTQEGISSEHAESWGEGGDLLIGVGWIGALEIIDGCSSDWVDAVNGAVLSLVKERGNPVVGMIFRGLSKTASQIQIRVPFRMGKGVGKKEENKACR